MKYKVLRISNNLEEYPEAKVDTETHPELIPHVLDEEYFFIMDEDGNFWEASEFFFMTNFKEFEVIEKIFIE